MSPDTEVFEPPASISADHATRTAYRLARLRRYPGRDKFAHRLAHRLWSLLEMHPAAREAYACPTDQTLAEHGADMTPDELDEAAARLAQHVGSDATL